MFLASFFSSQRLARWGLVPASLAVLTLAGCSGGIFKRNKTPDYSAFNTTTQLDSFESLNDKQVAELKFAAARNQESNGALEESLATYREVAKLEPNRGDVPHRMAIVYDKLAQFDKSPEYYQKALQLSPGNADIYCDMGYSQYLQQRFQEAEMNLRQAVKLKPDHTRANNNLGMVLAHTGRVDESLQAFRRGGAKAEDAHTNVAFALASHGQFADARKHYKLALAHDPEFAKAQDGLSEIDRLQEKAERIRAVAQEFGTLEQEPLASYAASNGSRSTIVGPNAAVANATRMAPRAATTAQAPVSAPAVTPENKQASAEPAPWAQQRLNRPADEVKPVKAMVPPQMAKAPAKAPATPATTPVTMTSATTSVTPSAEKPVAAKPTKAPKLSFSKGALHRDRYLEEQTDPALQQAGFSTASE